MKNANPLSSAAAAILGLAALGFAGCGDRTPPAAAVVPIYTYEVVHAWPHDRGAFTEGLTWLDGGFLESTGLNGASTLRKVDLVTGEVRQQVGLAPEYFGEGTTVLGQKVYQLTWKNQRGFVYRLGDLEKIGEFSYAGEGWGLTTDGQALVMSDGTNEVRFIDPATFAVTRTISVFSNGQPLTQLNELEYVKGELWANIWQTPFVARIDPATGRLLGLVDFAGLLAPGDFDRHTDVLNGIAYDAADDRLFVTGKDWPKLFEVRLRQK